MTPVPRVLLVTGASSGIGRATALRAAGAGEHLVLVARGLPPLEKVAAECRAAGAASTTVRTADVGDDVAVRDLVDEVVRAHGRIDAVVNAAGVVAYGRTDRVPARVFDGVVRTNLLGSANVARHVLPVLRQQGSGTLVLVGSVVGHVAAPSMTPYAVSKWGVRALARQLRLETRDAPGVHVVHVAPGAVDTPIYEQAANHSDRTGRPPPPVDPPEKVARAVVGLLDRPRAAVQVGLLNGVLRYGSALLPAVYDRVAGPVFDVVAVDRSRPAPVTDGNVLAPPSTGHRLRGGYGSSLRLALRNLTTGRGR